VLSDYLCCIALTLHNCCCSRIRYPFLVRHRSSAGASYSTARTGGPRCSWHCQLLGGSDFCFYGECTAAVFNTPTIPGPVPTAVSKDNSASYGNPFTSSLDRNAPQLPGAVTHEPDFRAPASYDPQSQSRQLDPSNVVPVVAPGAGQLELADDLGLSSYSFDVEAIRRDFPILREQVNGHPLIWLDNGATTQKPQSVIDRLSYFYKHKNSNVHRAVHELAARSTDAYESAREKTWRFLNAGASREIVFVRGATEAINLLAQSWGRRNIQKDDEIVIT